MRALALAPALALALVAAGCTTTLSVSSRTLAHGAQSGVTSPERDIITTEAQWQSLWANHTATGASALPDGSPAPLPQVDFAKETVIAAFLGNEPTSCFDVALNHFGTDGDALTVNVTTFTPDPARACAQVVTQPFVIVAFSGSFKQGNVTLVESTRQGPAP